MKQQLSHIPGPIGVFDSGYGGLTILEKIREVLPEYDYIYLGDNARAPYGTRSFEIVYEFTLQAVNKLFEMGCHLVILACNTASAKALRSIQMNDLPELDRSPEALLPAFQQIFHQTHSHLRLPSSTHAPGKAVRTGNPAHICVPIPSRLILSRPGVPAFPVPR